MSRLQSVQSVVPELQSDCSIGAPLLWSMGYSASQPRLRALAANPLPDVFTQLEGRFTLESFQALSSLKDGRTRELLHGLVSVRPAHSSEERAQILTLALLLMRLPDLDVMTHSPLVLGDDTQLVPAVSVFSGSSVRYLQSGAAAPTLVVEMLSSDADGHIPARLDAYRQAGVCEHWQIRRDTRQLTLTRLALPTANRCFGELERIQSLALPSVQIELDRIFSPLPRKGGK